MAQLGKAFIEVRADLSKFPAELREKLRRALKEGTADVDFDELGQKAEVAGERAADKAGDGFERRAKTRLRKAGRDGGNHLVGGLLDAVTKTLASRAVLIGGVVSGIVAAAFAALPAAVATGATIPAFLTGIIGLVASLKLSFRGVGDAVKAAFSGDSAKLAEAMKNLAPAARAFVLELKSVQPILKDFQQSVQQGFFVLFRGTVKELVTQLLPQLKGQVTGIASQLGAAGKASADVLVDPQNIALIVESLASFRRVLADVLTSFPNFVQAFLTLAKAATPFAEILGGQLAKGINQFAEAVAKANASGSLSKMFETGLAVLSDLGGLLGDVFSIIKSIFTAVSASGAGLFTTLSAITNALAAFLASAEGQGALSALLDLLHTLGQALVGVGGPLLKVLAAAVKVLSGALGPALDRVLPVLVQLAERLADVLIPVIEALAPALAAIAEQLALGLVDVLSALVELLGDPAVVQGLVLVAEAISVIIPLLAPLIRLLIDLVNWFVFLPEVAKKVGTALGTLVGEKIKAFLEFLPKVVAFFRELPDRLRQLVVDGFNFILEDIGRVIGLVIAEVLLLPQQIGIAFDKIVAFAFALPGRMVAALVQVKDFLVGAFRDGVAQARGFVEQGFNAVVAFLFSLPSKIAQLGPRMLSAARDLGHKIGDGLAQIGNFASDIGHKIVNAIKSGINFIIDGINRGIAQIDDKIPIGLPRLPRFEKGGIVDSPTLAVLGERGKREVVLPLTDPQRAQQLALQSGLFSVLRQGQGTPTINFTAILDGWGLIGVVRTVVDNAIAEQGQQLAAGARAA
jgi:phage-related protein